MTSFRVSNRMFVGVTLFIEYVSWSYFIGWAKCVLLIIRILYCWCFVPLVSFCPYYFILFLHNITVEKNAFDSKILKSDSNSKRFSFFVFDFNITHKICSNPNRLLNFQEFSNPPLPVYSNSHIKFWRIF